MSRQSHTSTPVPELRGAAAIARNIEAAAEKLSMGQPKRSHSRTTIMTEAGRQPWYDAEGKPIQPYIVGVAGGSASGKTSIAKEILKRLPNVSWVAILSQDAFYRPLNEQQIQQAFEQNFDFDHPNAIDQELLVQCVKDLKASRAVQVPIYSFTQHQRLPETTYLYGHTVLVLEGLFVLHDPALRDLLDLKIFVQTDPDIMLARRIRRDIVDRGRSVDGVLDQYLRFVKPSFDTFVGPSARYADIIVPGMHNAVAIDVIGQHIAKHLTRARTLLLRQDIRRTLEPAPFDVASGRTFPLARLRVGTSVDGTPVHVVELAPFPEQGDADGLVAHTDDFLPLPPNLCVIPPKAQLQAMLTVMHDVNTASGDFAWACKRAGAFVAEAAMKLLPYRSREICTPTGEKCTGVELDVTYICGVSILRSGAILEQPLRRALPALALGSLLIQSSGTNYRPMLYSVSLPSFVKDRTKAAQTWVLLTDAQIGTGAAAFMAVRVLLDHGVPENQIILLTLLVSAQGGVWSLQHAFPQVRIITAGVDPGLQQFTWPDQHDGYTVHTHTTSHAEHYTPAEVDMAERQVFAITPGCGQMGDRFWGT